MITFLMAMLAIVLIYSDLTDETKSSRPASKINSSSLSQNFEHSPLVRNEQRVRRVPQAIIIGSRKSGTRALLKFLEVNPAIRAAHSEVHFFDKPQNYKRGYDWYRSQMPESYSHEVTIEKSPAYFVTPDVPQKVKTMNSSIKLVLIFRNPVVRLISDFSQIVANRMELPDDGDYLGGDYGGLVISERLEEQEANVKNGSTSKSFWDKAETDFSDYVLRLDGGIDEQRRAVKIGMYSNYLERWRALFPMNQFHFVDGENLISNPYEELHRLELFLGLKPVIRRENFVFNAKKGFFCLVAGIERPQDLATRSNNAGSGAKQARPDFGAPNCLSRSKGRRHVKVKKELLEELKKFYEPYNEYLYSLVGHNFNWSSINL